LSMVVNSQAEAFPGQLLTLVLRPEKVNLVSLYRSQQNHLRGIIEDMIYLGTDTRYRVRLTPNTTIIIRQQNLQRDRTQVYQVGDRVDLYISPENISLLAQ
ncbi:MAG: TOBE domain-containing protein, partial [Cyanobacteriota bacterium]|nr:TOBE domain-containing protein [Cyanobacteriota bacterium]